MKKKILSFLLSASLLAAAVVPASPVTAQGTEEDNGMHISKTATANGDGTYTISLEAYATGEKVISEVSEDVPTDIVLVLDQSGSMAQNFNKVEVSYNVSNRTNSANYTNRNNLWYQLNDGTYVAVTVERKEIGDTYTQIPTNTTNSRYYNNYRNNLYQKVGDGYLPVDISREFIWDWFDSYQQYTYTFSDETKILSDYNDGVPDFKDRGPLYYKSGFEYEYTYSYTLNGEKYEIETSQGDSAYPKETYYTKSERVVSTTTKLEALKEALSSFVDSVNEKAAGADGILGTEDDINHRVAVAGFASQSYYGNNTELLSVSGENSSYGSYQNGGTIGVAYNNLTPRTYRQAFQNMDTLAGQTMVDHAIEALDAEGATRADLGMKMAQNILTYNPVSSTEKRNRVVIMFTDGSPTDNNGFEKGVAESAISTSTAIKNDGTTKVYTVGIFNGADASSAGTEPNGDLSDSSSQLSAASNWFMQQVSSNNGTVQDPSYYMAASDTDALNSIFEQISDDIEQGGTSSTLTSDAVVKDIISPYFTLLDGADANDITLETYHCTGKVGDEYTWEKNPTTMGATATVDGKNVSVTGFDFSENYVAEIKEDGEVTGYQGHKLVITFKVVPEDGFLGGNNVPTNDGAYIYENASSEDPLLTFNVPEVNVPIENVTVNAQDKNIYLLGSLSQENVLDGATAQVGDVELQLGEDGYGLDPWQYEFVDITPTFNAGNYTNLENDDSYTLGVTVEPTKKGIGASGEPAKKQENSDTAAINVFKPEITWQDSQINAGETADYNDNFVKAEWKHNEKVAVPAEMIGTEPTLTYEYTPEAGAFTQETPVKVTVKIGGQEINQYINFLHANNCTFPDCKWDEVYKNQDYHFVVHIKSFDLTIEKTGCEAIDKNQSFVFSVTGPNGYSTQVVIPGNGSVTIKGLPAGEYTITEDTSWSWRYEPEDGVAQTVTVDHVENGTATVTFKNIREEEKWLDGNAYARNLFDGSND